MINNEKNNAITWGRINLFKKLENFFLFIGSLVYIFAFIVLMTKAILNLKDVVDEMDDDDLEESREYLKIIQELNKDKRNKQIEKK